MGSTCGDTTKRPFLSNKTSARRYITPRCLNPRQLTIKHGNTTVTDTNAATQSIHKIYIMHSNNLKDLKALYYLLYITILVPRLDYWWAHRAAQTWNSYLVSMLIIKMAIECSAAILSQRALVICTLVRPYIRCYHRYKPGQVGEQIGRIHSKHWEPISGKSQTDLAFCWMPWGVAPAGSDPFLKGYVIFLK